MLKTTGWSNWAPRGLKANDNEIVGGSSKVDKMIKNISQSKKSKNVKFEIPTYTNIRATEEPTFLISSAKETFN